MVHSLHSRLVGGMLLFLVILDVILVFINIIIELEIIQGNVYFLFHMLLFLIGENATVVDCVHEFNFITYKLYNFSSHFS